MAHRPSTSKPQRTGNLKLTRLSAYLMELGSRWFYFVPILIVLDFILSALVTILVRRKWGTVTYIPNGKYPASYSLHIRSKFLYSIYCTGNPKLAWIDAPMIEEGR